MKSSDDLGRRVEVLGRVETALVAEVVEGGRAIAFAEHASSPRAFQRRSVPRRRYRRGLFVALAALVALLLVSQALGVAPGIGSIFGNSAPKPVKKTFAIVHFGGGVDTSSIRLISQNRVDGHLLRLWQARQASGGGLCTLIQIDDHTDNGVGCGVPTKRYGVSSWSTGGPKSDSFFSGFAPPGTATARLRFADGSTMDVPVTAGAWVTALRPSRRVYGHDLRLVSELAKDGHVIVSQPFRFAAKPIVPVSPRLTIARFDGRPLTVARANIGGVCVAFSRTGGPAIDSCPGLTRQGFGPSARNPGLFDGPDTAWMVRVSDQHSFGRLMLFGPLRSRSTSARIVYADGTRRAVHVSHGAFYLELPTGSNPTPARLEYLRGPRIVKTTLLAGPKTALYRPGWRGARYKLVLFGDYNSLDYTVGPLEWPNGRPAKPR